jgi:hypothetical protein
MLIYNNKVGGPITFKPETTNDAINIGMVMATLTKKGIAHSVEMDGSDIKGFTIEKDKLIVALLK